MQERDQNEQQKANPEKMAATDEQQRTKGKEDDKQQQVPTGNEKDQRTDTEGTRAGMGE